MPGVCGVIDRTGEPLHLAPSLLCHLPDYSLRARRLSANVAVAQVWRDEDDSKHKWHESEDVSVYVAGDPQDVHTGAHISAESIHGGLVGGQPLRPGEFDGSFSIVVVDGRRQEVTLCTDPLGCLALYVAASPGRFAFGPEAKVVFSAIDVEPKLDPAGVIGFLACGYCLGRTTIFRGVQVMLPGSLRVVSFDAELLREERYFQMNYRKRSALARRSSAEDALHDAMVGSARHICGTTDEDFDMMLSGGLDSRAMLASIEEIGKSPRSAFSWGLRDDIPGSDPAIARALATAYGVPFRFLSYDTGSFVERARQWCRIGELANDNVGWLAEGAPVLAEAYRTRSQWMLSGDECWGVGGYVRDETEAWAAVLPPALPASFRNLLSDSQVSDHESTYRDMVAGVLATCMSERPADRRDYLYVHGRLCRFVFSLGYFKELAVAIRRPFTSHMVLAIMQGIPGSYRAYKNLFVSTVKRFYPRVMQFPDASVDSLPDWEYDIRAAGPLRSMVVQLLDDGLCDIPVIGELLDADRFRVHRDAYFSRPPVAMRRVPDINRTWYSRALGDRIKRESAAFDRLRRMVGHTTQKRHRSEFQILLALAQLRMLAGECIRWKRDAIASDEFARFPDCSGGKEEIE